MALSWGLAQYILDAPRTDLISSNKEGIISVPGIYNIYYSPFRGLLKPGYLAIQLIGLAMGTLVLPPSPSYFRRRLRELAYPHARHTHDSSSDEGGDDDDVTHSSSRHDRFGQALRLQRRENDKTATELCSYAVLWWAVLGIASLVGIGGGVSRRMVRCPWVLPHPLT